MQVTSSVLASCLTIFLDRHNSACTSTQDIAASERARQERSYRLTSHVYIIISSLKHTLLMQYVGVLGLHAHQILAESSRLRTMQALSLPCPIATSPPEQNSKHE